MTLAPAQDQSDADFSTQDAAYVSPSYLRTPLREFLLTNDRGLYWLRAPAGLGKTLFARGIVARRPGRDPAVREGIDSAISSDVRSFGVHVAAGASAADVLAALEAAFAAEFGLAPGAADPGEDLAGCLKRWHEHVVSTGAKRLMVCIDGLEKLAEGAAASLVPPASAVPAGVILLLTSRPLDEAPGLAPVPTEGAVIREVSYGDTPYKDMLQRYFKDRTRPLLRQKVVNHFSQLLETKTAFERGGRDNRLTNDPELRDALKGDWKKLTNKYPRYTGLPLPVAPLVGHLDQFDQLWVDLIERSDKRFDDLSAMLDALTAETLPVEAVAGLPKGEALRAHLETLPKAASAG